MQRKQNLASTVGIQKENWELNNNHAFFRDNKASVWKKKCHSLLCILLVFLTRECAHAHERVIAIVAFSLGRSVSWLVGWFGC